MSEQQAGGAVSRPEREIVEWLVESVAEALGEAPDTVDPHRPLTELGLSSRDGVALAADLEDWLDIELPATLVWETPTIAALAHRLATGDLESHASGAEPAVAAPAAPAGADDDLVAIVGLGCRFPGGIDGPESFWDLLINSREGVSQVPEGRWESFGEADAATTAILNRTTRWGGFLDDVKGFDAEFFGITPLEAKLMDPQQRMLLEVAWEALEHAGIPASSLKGSATGVYVGISGNEYSHLTASDLSRVEAWTATGVALSIAANRMSYLLDLRGPSVALDTACSSSLVAVHQACQSIRAGETDQAIVAGVNLTLAPPVTVNFDVAGLLAEDGRCKTFSAEAGGIVRSEGAGVVVLKRLADARRDGDRVLAVIRGSAVNSDGRSNGMMAPNPQAQEAVLARAYQVAGLDTTGVDYVEAHGTGTLLGDPIEARALAAVLGRDRDDDRPLLIGSVKTNLGHLEAAAGVAGLIKVVLGLTHGKIPASLHAEELNPHIPWDRNHLKVARQATAWPRYSGVARAGVSAFGFGGTNAHVVVEEYLHTVEPAAPVRADDAAELLVVSGLDEARMREAAGVLASWLDSPAGHHITVGDIAATVGRRRELGQFRGAVAGRSRDELAEGLRRLSDGVDGPVVVSGKAEKRGPGARKGPVWVFSGYGSQWAGMGKVLLADEPSFAAAVEELDPLFRVGAGFSLEELIRTGGKAAGVDQTQIAIFGIQVALAATWRSYGVEPAAIVGHSMGEVAAAVCSGALDLADGVRVITARSQLLESVSAEGGGSMAVVELSSEEIEELVAERFPNIGVAVYAAPTQCTIAGDSDQMEEFVAHVEGLGRNAWVLNVVGAAHSPAVDKVLEPLRTAVADIRPGTANVPFFSTVLEDSTATPAFDPEYWMANLRRPVRFSQAIAAAAAEGYDTFIEISPHPVTVMSIRAVLEAVPPAGAAGRAPLVLGTLKRDTDDAVTMRAAVGSIIAAGHDVDLDSLWPATVLIDTPRTAWKHVDYWVEPRRTSVGLPAGSHTLLGVGGELPEGDRYVWRSDIGLESHPWLKDHAVQGVAVLSGTSYAEMAVAAGVEVFGVPIHEVVLSNLELDEILTLTDHTTVMTSVKVTAPLTGQVEIFAKRGSGTGGWVRHASAVVVGDAAPAVEPFEVDLAALERGGKSVDIYREFAELGHSYGPAFTGVSDAFATADGVASARVTLPPEAPHDASFHAHPALLDICLQVLAVAAAGSSYAEQFGAALYLPLGLGRLQVRRGGAVGGHVYANLRPLDEHGLGLLGAIRLVDEDGNLIMEARDVYLRRLERSDVPKPLGEKLFTTAWQQVLPVQHAGERDSKSWVLLSAGDPADDTLRPVVEGAEVIEALHHAGDTVLGDAVVEVRTAADAVAAIARAAELDVAPECVVLLTTDRRELPVGLTEQGLAPGEHELLVGVEVARALLESDIRPVPRLRFVTRGAVALSEGEAGQPAAASLRGLVRTLAFEHPELRTSIVDLDPAGDDAVHQLVSELRSGAEHDEVAWRDGARLTARMTRAPLPAASEGAVVRPGAYIVAGSLSGVGLEFGRWLSRRGARRVVLGGRSEPSEAALAVIAEMRERGTEVEVVRGDIAAPEVAEAMVAAATAGGMRLCGAAHAANQLHDQLIGSVDAEGISTVWGPKVQGAWRLHEATLSLDLDWWLVFSSVASLMGSPGQAAYAAANAWLDALVTWRRGLGLPGTSINWGPWAEVGKGQDVDWAFMEQIGVSEGMEALDVILGAGLERIGVVRLNAAGAVDVLPSFRQVPYFADLVAEASAVAEDSDEDWIGVAGLRALSPEDARQVLSDRIVSRMAAIMGFHPHQVDRDKPLTQLGFDSLMAVRARNAVQSDLGLPMPVRLLLQGATLTDLEQHLAGELGLGDVVVAGATAPGEKVLGARDPSERFLALVWSEVLERSGLGVTQEFSSLGGDPVSADAIAERVADRLGDIWTADVLFDVEALHGQITIEKQADLIREALEGNAGRPVRPLRARGSRPPLFFFHPAGGPTSVYEPLVGLLDGDQPVYGLERLEELDTVETKATRYIELIQEIQPAGPYRLAGWSLGGTLAYETAMQLTAAGEQVDVVVMLDTILPLELDNETDSDLLVERLGRFIEQMEETYDVKVDFDLDSLRDVDEHTQIRMLKELMESTGLEMSAGVVEHQRTSYLDGRVAERYTPRAYDGRVVLYRATDFNPELVAADARYQRTDESHGWDEFASQLAIHPVPGDHVSMIDRPNVDAVAVHLDAVLAQLSLQRV